MHWLKRLLQYTVPSAVFFEDGSRVDYLSASSTLIYRSPTGRGIGISVRRGGENTRFTIELPGTWIWNKPADEALTNEEVQDVKSKVALYVEKQGSFFVCKGGNARRT